MKRFVLLIFVLCLVAILVLAGVNREVPFEKRRQKVLSELTLAIEDAEEQGRYKCCIEPACTMCYLGNWIWEDGSCYCDDMIAEGQDAKVCPQCLRGLEDGICDSALEEPCDPDSTENFRSI